MESEGRLCPAHRHRPEQRTPQGVGAIAAFERDDRAATLGAFRVVFPATEVTNAWRRARSRQRDPHTPHQRRGQRLGFTRLWTPPVMQANFRTARCMWSGAVAHVPAPQPGRRFALSAGGMPPACSTGAPGTAASPLGRVNHRRSRGASPSIRDSSGSEYGTLRDNHAGDRGPSAIHSGTFDDRRRRRRLQHGRNSDSLLLAYPVNAHDRYM